MIDKSLERGMSEDTASMNRRINSAPLLGMLDSINKAVDKARAEAALAERQSIAEMAEREAERISAEAAEEDGPVAAFWAGYALRALVEKIRKGESMNSKHQTDKYQEGVLRSDGTFLCARCGCEFTAINPPRPKPDELLYCERCAQ